jgi:5,10-methylenetetrahydromethanopterin reductase
VTLTRVGVVFPASAPVERLPTSAQCIEAAGYDELWVVEDCFLSGGLVMASTALAVTSRLRVGVGILPAPVRNPAIAAMEIACLARLHPSRLSVAFGHGVRSWMKQIDALPAARLTALGEVTAAVRSLLAGAEMSVDGRHVRLDRVVLARPPDIPPAILIGSTGPKGIALAHSVADGVLLPQGSGPAFISSALGHPGAGAEAEVNALTVVYVWLRIEDDDEVARLALRPALDEWLGSGLYPEPVRASGIEPGMSPDAMTTVAAGELAIAGGREACRRSMARFAGIGAQSVVLAAVGDDFEAQYQRFAEEVLPELRRDPNHSVIGAR